MNTLEAYRKSGGVKLTKQQRHDRMLSLIKRIHAYWDTGEQFGNAAPLNPSALLGDNETTVQQEIRELSR